MTNRRVDVVEEGFDVAVRVRSLPLEPSNLAMRRLGESSGVVVGSPALLGKLGRPKHPRELERYPTLSMTTAGDRHVWHFREKDGSPIAVNHVPRLMTDSFDGLREAAVVGVGVAYLPHFVVQQYIESGHLEPVLSEFGLPEGLAHVVFPTRRGMVPAVRALIDALVEGFKESGPTSRW
jgi:DNA-binding transcriptional LysR family regulator